MDKLENELVELIGKEFEVYMDYCDGRIDPEEFVREAKESIEGEYGDKFDNYSMESYCISYCERKQDIYGGDYE